jgi:hypothetical protein
MTAAEPASYTIITNSIGYDGQDPDMMVANCIYRYILDHNKVIQVYVSQYWYILV